jgi:hypothetical protein
MAHSPCTEFTAGLRANLLALARTSITQTCAGAPLGDDAPELHAALTEPAFAARRNCFVTLLRNGALRGCIGSLEPRRPLAEDVVANAAAAAFRDPRFAPVAAPELPRITVQLSVLSLQQPFPVASQAELLEQLEPFVDGLTLEDGANRATFLPKVWEQLPDPATFLLHLKAKAGLPPDHWSHTLRFWRYRAENFSE